MAISPQKPLSPTQVDALVHAFNLAEAADKDLRTNAGDGARARPTLAQINRTLDRLVSIKNTLNIVLLDDAVEKLP